MTCDVNKRDKLFPKSVIAKNCFHTNENKGATLPMEIAATTSDWVKSTSVKRLLYAFDTVLATDSTSPAWSLVLRDYSLCTQHR